MIKEEIKLRIQNQDDREKIVLALVNNGYRVWVEEDDYSQSKTLFYVIFEIDETELMTKQKIKEFDTVAYCDRCGKKFCELGKVLEWGKFYPAFRTKDIHGKITEHSSDREIKSAVCVECAKCIFDNHLENLVDL